MSIRSNATAASPSTAAISTVDTQDSHLEERFPESSVREELFSAQALENAAPISALFEESFAAGNQIENDPKKAVEKWINGGRSNDERRELQRYMYEHSSEVCAVLETILDPKNFDSQKKFSYYDDAIAAFSNLNEREVGTEIGRIASEVAKNHPLREVRLAAIRHMVAWMKKPADSLQETCLEALRTGDSAFIGWGLAGLGRVPATEQALKQIKTFVNDREQRSGALTTLAIHRDKDAGPAIIKIMNEALERAKKDPQLDPPAPFSARKEDKLDAMLFGDAARFVYHAGSFERKLRLQVLEIGNKIPDYRVQSSMNNRKD